MSICVVTGGAGFIGSHLTKALVEDGHTVRVIDSLRTGKRENLAAVADRVDFREASILDEGALAEVMAGADLAFHLAALVSVPESVAKPKLCHEICATGTLNVVTAARDAGVKRIVYASTSAAYGEPPDGPIPETHPVTTKSPYAAGKLAGEYACVAAQATSDVEAVALRFFNVFGPNQDPSSPYSGVIAIFCQRMLRGQAPTIFGDGSQSRDFVHVSDVVAALRLAATTDGVSGRVYNVGRGEPVTLLDLVAAINDVEGTDLRPTFAAERVGDIRVSLADIGRIRRELGYDPRTSFRDGLKDCLEYYRQLETD